MRRLVLVLALAISLMAAMTVPVGAATLHEPHQNTPALKCVTGEIGLWHFVANQTEQTSQAFIKVTWSDNSMFMGGADRWNRGTQHWFVRGPLGLMTAQSFTDGGKTVDLPGKLVLSSAECVKKTKS